MPRRQPPSCFGASEVTSGIVKSSPVSGDKMQLTRYNVIILQGWGIEWMYEYFIDMTGLLVVWASVLVIIHKTNLT